jgi:EmrB/QacA subfamily drug resistance transporter
MTTRIPARPDLAGVDPRRWLSLAVIAMATLMVVLDASIVSIALPQAQTALEIPDADRHWVVTAYTLTFGGLLLLGGRIADFVGRKRIFVIGLLGFAAASALGGFAVSAEMLFDARALQGMFAALLAPAALALITVTFTRPNERTRALGIYGAVSGAGGAAGVILGGLLTEYIDWRWCLFVNIPIAVAAAIAAIPLVRESRASGPRHYDVPGAVLVTAGFASLVYGFTQVAESPAGWLSPGAIGFIAASIVLLIAFVIVELRTAHPLLPLRILTDRNRAGAFLTSLFSGAGMFGMLIFVTYYLQINLGYSPIAAGLAFLPFAGSIIAASLLVPALLPRLGTKTLMVAGMAIATLGMVLLIGFGATTPLLIGIIIPEVLIGAGLGLSFVPLSTIVLSTTEAKDSGVASATLTTTQQLGGALGVALLNTLYIGAVAAGGETPPSMDSLLSGYHVAFIGASVLLFAGLLASILLVSRRGRRHPRRQGTEV